MIKRFLGHFRSIKYKFLFANLALLVILCSSIIYLWNVRTAQDTRISVGEYINEMLKITNDNLEVSLKDIYGLVNIAASDSDIVQILSKPSTISDAEYVQDDRKMRKYIAGLFTYKHYLNDITIAGNERNMYSLGHSVSFDFLTGQPWYGKLWNQEGATVLIPPHYNSDNPVTSSSQDDKVISIAKPVYGDNQAVGFVLADVRTQLLTDIFSSNLKGQVKMLVADTKTGNLIFKPQLAGLDQMASDSNAFAPIIQRIRNQEGSFYTRLGKVDYLIVYRYSPLTEWMMVALVPKSHLLEQFHQTRNLTLLISILFCGAAAIVSILVSSFLTKSILRLNRAINKVDGEHLHLQIQIKSNDEIGQLYRQFNQMVHRMKELMESTKRTEQEKRKAEIRALQAQINPHFLYNSLNTIKFLSVYQGADNIRKVTESLSKLMHIAMKDHSFITVAEELDYLQCYMNIQEFKYSNKFTYSVSVEDEMMICILPKLLLQPLLENALLHGIGPMKGQGMITLKGYRDGDLLIFRLQDNGVGMTQDAIDKIKSQKGENAGLGIRNVSSRIEMTFGHEYGVSVVSEPRLYTIVEVTLPAIERGEEDQYV
ncbi:sensor histidine kinase [Cohnella suwonensis]|uniref:Sensor histidine kinase n=1 Tax=Cohnella suwonensis TaxID=696072 RepID=A0ABW0M1C1_9BACL